MIAYKIVYHLLHFSISSRQVIVHQNVVELSGSELHLGLRLGHSSFDCLLCVGPASHKSPAQHLHRRCLDEHGQCLISEDPLEVHSSLDVDVEYDHMSLCPDPLHFRLQCAVE